MIRWILCGLRAHRMCRYIPTLGLWECRCGAKTETDQAFLERMAGW